MGLLLNVERAPITHAITEATAGIKATKLGEVIRGGESSADYKIAAGIDGGRVLAAVDRLPDLQRMWFTIAYAAPLSTSTELATELYARLVDESQSELIRISKTVRAQQLEMMPVLMPLVALSVSRDQQCGANVETKTAITAAGKTVTLKYVPKVKPVSMISALVHAEAMASGVDLDSDAGTEWCVKRSRALKAHWARDWEPLIEVMRTVIIRIDQAAQKSFKKWLH